MIEVFTDGACLGNPGPGGWGVLILDGDCVRELSGGESETTNNRMELMAAIRALEETNGDRRPIILHTDSQYVKNGITTWINGWKRNGWKTASRKPVKNRDLWEALDTLIKDRKIDWRWVKGHAGHNGNERADTLASEAAQSVR